jgi:hypothetical protein
VAPEHYRIKGRLYDRVIIGAEPDDEVFHYLLGSWNVTKAMRDAALGKFGTPTEHPIETSLGTLIAVDYNVVDAYTLSDKCINDVLLSVFTDWGLMLIDGHHRIRARRKRGFDTFWTYVIPKHLEEKYIVRMSKERK